MWRFNPSEPGQNWTQSVCGNSDAKGFAFSGPIFNRWGFAIPETRLVLGNLGGIGDLGGGGGSGGGGSTGGGQTDTGPRNQGSGDNLAVPEHWRFTCDIRPDPLEVDLLTDAAGEWVLTRRLINYSPGPLTTSRWGYLRVHSKWNTSGLEWLHFPSDKQSYAYWTTSRKGRALRPSAGGDGQSESDESGDSFTWHLAYNAPWGHIFDHDGFTSDIGEAWVLWFGPQIQSTPSDKLGSRTSFVVYTSDGFRGPKTRFDALHANTFQTKTGVGGTAPKGDDPGQPAHPFLNFPDAITIEPYYP